MSLPGFRETRHLAGEADLYVAAGGAGTPVVLLRGFPETSFCWRRVAPRLAPVAPASPRSARLRRLARAAGGPRGEGYSKREMATEIAGLMAALGHERFAVVGHDRGARVACRLALDHPARVTRVAVLNTVPTIEQFERIGRGPVTRLLALVPPRPAGSVPERLLSAATDAVLEHVFATWAAAPNAIDAGARALYRRAMDETTIAAMCAGYRASFHIDRRHDAEDREAGMRIEAPLLLVTGSEESQLAGAPEVWHRWADDVTTVEVPVVTSSPRRRRTSWSPRSRSSSASASTRTGSGR